MKNQKLSEKAYRQWQNPVMRQAMITGMKASMATKTDRSWLGENGRKSAAKLSMIKKQQWQKELSYDRQKWSAFKKQWWANMPLSQRQIILTSMSINSKGKRNITWKNKKLPWQVWNKGGNKNTDARIAAYGKSISRLYLAHPELHPNNKMQVSSKPQLALYGAIKTKWLSAVLEYPVRTSVGIKFCDIAVPEHQIELEYDGAYWHRNKDDAARDKALAASGWHVIHINEETMNKLQEFDII